MLYVLSTKRHYCAHVAYTTSYYNEYDYLSTHIVKYDYPDNGATSKIGADVSSYDGSTAYFNTPASYHGIVPRGADFGIYSGTSHKYTKAASLGFSWKGKVGLTASYAVSTEYNQDHYEDITAGNGSLEHDIFGNNGKPGVDNVNVFYSY
jgi:hypothetical protein